ncbi:tuftelin-interacting protein 11, partial [Tremellales sp. Uapishka_1]
MARRKNGFLSDGDDSDPSQSEGSDGGYNSQEDGDSRAERALFEHNGRKRRKMGGGGKEAAWEGIFGEEEEDRSRARGSGSGGRGLRGGRGGVARSDWTKAPAFVSTSSKPVTPLFQTTDNPDAMVTQDESSGNNSADSSGQSDSEDAENRPRSPLVRATDYDDDEQPRQGMGLGFKGGFAPAGASLATALADASEGEATRSNARPGIGSSARGRAGIGAASRVGIPPPVSLSGISTPAESTGASTPVGGIGSSTAPPQPIAEHAPSPAISTAFGRAAPSRAPASSSREQSTFKARPQSFVKKPIDVAAHDMSHLRKIESSFGAKLLAKQGWEAGRGLGKNEDGRAVPIQVGKIMKGRGLTKGVRTEDSKREARKLGEVFSDDEDEKPKRAKGKRPPGSGAGVGNQKAEQSWKNQKKLKTKVEHKTYEQLLAEAGDAPAGVGLVLDARGGELKEVHSLSSLSLSAWTPTSDKTRLPELRHNLRLIADVAKADVEALAREGKTVNDRRRWALREEEVSRQKIMENDRRISRLTKVQEVVVTISRLAAEQTSKQDEPSLLPLAESFDALLHDFKDEYTVYKLDDVVVGAIGQVLRRAFSNWQPFDISSDILLASLKTWRMAYNLSSAEEDVVMVKDGVSRNGAKVLDEERVMTAWESLLWTLWMPKVRSAINNDWDASSPHVAVHLLESWESILPQFIRDNVLDQLILPKVKKTVESWDPRPSRSGKPPKSLAGIVFPWLPLLGDRVEEVLSEGKRRIKSVMRAWVVKDGVPEELTRWKKDIYTSAEWDKLVLQYVVPKLGVCLREDFSVNPRNQDMVPLEEWVMPWHTLLRSSVFSHLMEVEFFPKWLNILHVWLIQPSYKPDEVANWFIYWKSRFPEAVLEMRGISHGFNSGLDLMNDAMRLGPSAPSQLRKPTYEPLPSSRSSSKSKSKAVGNFARLPPPSEPTDITFRSLAEDYAAQHDLIFLPLGRSHETTGKPLFRVSKGVDGRGGVTVYVGEDAVFALGDEGTYRAVTLEDMVKRAKGV